jgi:hypothetical protein
MLDSYCFLFSYSRDNAILASPNISLKNYLIGIDWVIWSHFQSFNTVH